MIKLIATTDLHQHPAKWKLLVPAIVEQKPDIVLIAGDILPKYDGFLKQREFFSELRRLLTEVRDEVGSPLTCCPTQKQCLSCAALPTPMVNTRCVLSWVGQNRPRRVELKPAI